MKRFWLIPVAAAALAGAASMAQATALGAALAIHKSWNKKRLPNTLIKLQFYAAAQTALV